MMDTTIREQVLRWCLTGETGLSSLAMARRFGGVGSSELDTQAHPHDPDDFRRCLLFLRAVPLARSRLGLQMRPVSPQWAALVDSWDRIEALFLAEVGLDLEHGDSAPRTYDAMKEIGL